MNRRITLLALTLVCALAWWGTQTTRATSSLDTMTTPQYNDGGELLLPRDYEGWVFVGSSLGLSYTETLRREGPGNFHVVYIQPQAYRHYRDTGTFPEKTMLVMENYSAGSKTNPNLHGHFSDEMVGLEVALKDTENFEDGWAYFNFTQRTGLRNAARAFPRAACYDCHEQHAVDDNVFVQFYPVLKREMVKQGRWIEPEFPSNQHGDSPAE